MESNLALTKTHSFHDGGSHVIDFIVASMAAVGGAARYLYEMQKNKTPFNTVKFVVKIGTCVFIGYTAWNASIGSGLNASLAIAISNLSAWLGVEAMSFAWEILQVYIRKRFG